MISALAWVPRGAASPVTDNAATENASLADTEVPPSLIVAYFQSRKSRMLKQAMRAQEELEPAEADGLESEGDSSASDSEMDEAAQIARAQAMAAAVKAKPLATEGVSFVLQLQQA